MSFGETFGDGSWGIPFDQVFSYKADETAYLFLHHNGEDGGGNDVEIREITGYGKPLGPITQEKFTRYFSSLTPLFVEGRFLYYGQCEADKSWFLQDLLPGGTLGAVTAEGTWHGFYPVMRGFNVDRKCYLLYHNENTEGRNDFFIQEVLQTGKLGETTESAKWASYYPVMVPLDFYGRTYIFGHSKEGNYWFIQEVTSEGKLGTYVDGTWDKFYSEAFSFKKEDRVFLYLCSESSDGLHDRVIREVLPDGQLGEISATDQPKHFYTPTTSYDSGGRSFYYGQYAENQYFTIRELLSPSE